MEKRKITNKEITFFKIGYASDKNSFFEILNKNFNEKQIIDSGIFYYDENKKTPNYEEFAFAPNAHGSGFIVGNGKYIITNHHVIKGAKKIAVRNGIGIVSNAKVKAFSKDYDSAILKFNDWNINTVSILWKSKGDMITTNPFKKYNTSSYFFFSLSRKSASSFPKWYDATIKKIIKSVFGKINQISIINKLINEYTM